MTVQKVVDTVGGNLWLALTDILSEEELKGGLISKEEYAGKITKTHSPLLGNGRQKREAHTGASLTSWLEQEADKIHAFGENCLFGAVMVAQQSSLTASTLITDWEVLARECKTRVMDLLRKLAKGMVNGPATQGTATANPNSLLGQMMKIISAEELMTYANFMENGNEGIATPAGALDICVLAHLMQCDFQVYR
jgi:hypothetical protein